MLEISIISAAFLVTYFGVAAFRRWSLKKELLDVPNHRSSHLEPTPRGAGLVIVVVCLSAYTLLSGISLSWGYLTGAAGIAIVSWFDDVYSVPFLWRYIVHSLAAVLVILDLGFFSEVFIPIYSQQIDIGILGAVLTYFWIVWLVNAYNFMDGIDGIAGLQAVVAGIGWLVLSYSIGIEGIALYAGVLTAASLAFLFHNWQPARVFMGDIGSAFLGFTLAAMPLLAVKGEPVIEKGKFPVAAVCFVFPFLFDTIVTLIRRLARGDRVWLPHREHLYQQLVIGGMAHYKVALVYGVLAAVSGAAAIAAIVRPGSIGLLFATGPLAAAVAIILIVRYKK
ncbi:MAG: glycosyltransferase family 4 protein [Pyrinomonadaceae bacterium]